MASVDDQKFDVPEVNLGQFMINNMKKYGSAVALVSYVRVEGPGIDTNNYI